MSKADYPSIIWWASFNQVKAFRKRLPSPEEEEILPADCLLTPAATAILPCVSGAYPVAFGGANPHYHMSQFLKNLSISHIYLLPHTTGSASLKNPNRLRVVPHWHPCFKPETGYFINSNQKINYFQSICMKMRRKKLMENLSWQIMLCI